MVTLKQDRGEMYGSFNADLQALTPVKSELFSRRATRVYPPPNGHDVIFSCHDHENNYYYCKDDRNGRPACATEMIFTRLADCLGIRTADWSIIEHDNELFFGSRHELSSADRFNTADFLTAAQTNEIGQPSHFPGEHLAQLRAFDFFIGNPDRSLENFLLVRDGPFSRICAIDFAAASLDRLGADRFPVAGDPTVTVGRLLAGIHGAFANSAVAMVDRIAAFPPEIFSRLVHDVPDEWLSQDKKGGLDAVWGSPGFHARLALLRSKLKDGTLV